jgi:AcrR family transcriptional regulator
MSNKNGDNEVGQRGPADHSVREQIIAAAHEHFLHFGYGKTTVSDLAKAIGFSKAYIYKFFDSKQAIGEAICTASLDSIINEVVGAAASRKSPPERLRTLFRTMISASTSMFFSERRIYDIATYSYTEKWSSSVTYGEKTLALLRQIIAEGRQSGDFERKTPLDETCRAVQQAMQPFINPVMLQYNLEILPDAANELLNLILRSLSP